MMKLYSNPGYSTINKMRLKVYKRKLGDIKIQIKEKSAALFITPYIRCCSTALAEGVSPGATMDGGRGRSRSN